MNQRPLGYERKSAVDGNRHAPTAAHEHATLGRRDFLNAIGARVEESGLGLIALHPYSAPYEDLKLKK